MPNAPGLPPIRPRCQPRPRLTTTERGYGWEHQQQRERLIRQFPICQRCENDWSAHLHHRDRNPHNRADSNVELLCHGCHAKEHAPAT
ncbi:hypothetical protein R5W23_000833 [Gemmata sp. JC673]|uniref:HNH endonuclease n=1 Tax=Gemmata algarum TaxID=2975278 RepID=A0ABU5ERY5_9BACT|nr:hypothetical protein [Gemmata algarum]MDY3558112.1 hypothetical protein [Gemmata algarum]